MGQLVDGEWQDVWYDTKKSGGKFVRSTAKFRNWITADGSPGPSGEGGFAAEADRYHLYVSYACPWAHRTLIFRALKELTDLITVSVVHPDMLSDGWTLADPAMAATAAAAKWAKDFFSTKTSLSAMRLGANPFELCDAGWLRRNQGGVVASAWKVTAREREKAPARAPFP